MKLVSKCGRVSVNGKMFSWAGMANRSLLIGLLVFPVLCSNAEMAADEFPSAADERDEIQSTWRLLERDIKYWNVVRPKPRPNTVAPCYQPPADQVANAESLITSKDRDPLDVVLRRTRALEPVTRLRAASALARCR